MLKLVGSPVDARVCMVRRNGKKLAAAELGAFERQHGLERGYEKLAGGFT